MATGQGNKYFSVHLTQETLIANHYYGCNVEV